MRIFEISDLFVRKDEEDPVILISVRDRVVKDEERYVCTSLTTNQIKKLICALIEMIS